jgi:hypothetical protein
VATYEHPITLGDGDEGGNVRAGIGVGAESAHDADHAALAYVRYDAAEGQACVTVVVRRLPWGDEEVGPVEYELSLDADAARVLSGILGLYPAGWRRLPARPGSVKDGTANPPRPIRLT